MIELKPNANQKLKEMMYENGVRAFYLDVCEKYSKNFVQVFITNMQTLIAKLGMMISEVSTVRVRIDHCSQSIHYLCKTVLDNPSLENKFDKIGINGKANKGKHTRTTNSIDMDMCVQTYNNLVSAIANKYNLHSLNDMIVKKKTQQTAAPVTNISAPQPKKPTTPKTSGATAKKNNHPDEFATTADEKLRLSARLERGDGRYQKGFLNKKSMINFLITISIDNPDNLKINSVTAYFKCGRYTCERKLSTACNSTTEIDLETSKFSGNIEASVIAVYKIGLLKTKQIKSTVSKNF